MSSSFADTAGAYLFVLGPIKIQTNQGVMFCPIEQVVLNDTQNDTPTQPLDAGAIPCLLRMLEPRQTQHKHQARIIRRAMMFVGMLPRHCATIKEAQQQYPSCRDRFWEQEYSRLHILGFFILALGRYSVSLVLGPLGMAALEFVFWGCRVHFLVDSPWELAPHVGWRLVSRHDIDLCFAW